MNVKLVALIAVSTATEVSKVDFSMQESATRRKLTTFDREKEQENALQGLSMLSQLRWEGAIPTSCEQLR